MARIRINQELNSPILGKPHLKFGQCIALGSYFFQLGGMLGARHQMNLDAFGDAFLGASGAPGAVKRLFTELANDIVSRSNDDSMTFYDYVSKEFSRGLEVMLAIPHAFLLSMASRRLRLKPPWIS